MAKSEAKKKFNEGQDIAAGILKDLAGLQGARGNWESHWQEIAERIWPNHSRLFQQQYLSTEGNQGEKRTEHLMDSTPSIALNRFASIVDSLLTPQNQTWHRVLASDPNLNKDREVRLWFEEVNRIMFKLRYSPLSNFAGQNNLNFKMLGAYGSCCMFIDKLKWHKEVGIRYKSMHLSGIYFRENHQGIIDTVYRHYADTARNALQQFGEVLPDSIKAAAKKSPDKNFFFVHCVKPRTDYDPERVDHKSKVFASYYVSVEGKVLLEEGGYDTFPYPSSRYEQVPGEVYGRSPAMDVLPAIKTLNAQKRVVLEQGHRTVRPVMLTHDDGIIDTFSLRPGAMNAGGMTADGRPLVGTLPVGNIAIGKDLMDDERAVINDANLVTLFQILAEDRSQMTATEVMERTREKGILIAPTLGRQQSEYLGSMIEREFELGQSLKLFPPVPQLLLEAKGEYRIEYESPLSRTAKAEEAAGAMRTVEMAINVATQTGDPSILDHLNWDEILPGTADINGMPAKWRNGMQQIQAIREGRAKQQEQDQQIKGAPGAAALIKSTAVAQKAQ